MTGGGDVPTRGGEQRLKQAIRRPGGAGVFWFALGSFGILEVALAARPDAVVLDLQHGLFTREGMESAIGLARNAVPTLVRVADATPTAIGQALDAGAEGILVPLVESAAEAAAVVRAAHYPPHGARSGGGVRPLARGFAAYVSEAAGIVAGVMIETAAGVGQAEAIARTPGIDLLFIGTGDLALSLGCFPEPDERHEAACRRVFEACQAAGVPCGIFTASADEAAKRRAEGYALVVVANDIGVIGGGFAQAQDRFGSAAGPAT